MAEHAKQIVKDIKFTPHHTEAEEFEFPRELRSYLECIRYFRNRQNN